MRTAQHWTNDARLCLVYAGTGSQLEHDVLLNLFSQCQSDALESAAKIADNLQSQLVADTTRTLKPKEPTNEQA